MNRNSEECIQDLFSLLIIRIRFIQSRTIPSRSGRGAVTSAASSELQSPGSPQAGRRGRCCSGRSVMVGQAPERVRHPWVSSVFTDFPSLEEPAETEQSGDSRASFSTSSWVSVRWCFDKPSVAGPLQVKKHPLSTSQELQHPAGMQSPCDFISRSCWVSL